MKNVSHYLQKNQDKGKGLEISSQGKKSSSWLKNKILIVISSSTVLLFLFLLAITGFLQRPISPNVQDFHYFEIKSGEGTLEIGRRLQNEGIIRSAYAFYVTSKIENTGILQVGSYKLSSAMDTQDIVDKIRNGKVDAFSVTIPEGYRVLQIAKVLQEKGGIDPSKFIEAALGTEGKLFPDTYVFPVSLEPSSIIKQMKDDFDKRTSNLKPDSDQLILASIVEREAKNDSERAKIAAVYKNRADQNMLLQADPTIRYAIDTQTYLSSKNINFVFWQPITRQDYLNIFSQYNTYKNKGYPPAPICNPGIKSIEAAINPEPGFTALYFFHDRDFKVHFSDAYDGQLKAIAQFGVAGE